MIKREQFFMEFRQKYPDITCPGILGLDVRKNEDNIRANKEGLYTTLCPQMFEDIVAIVKKLIA